MEEETKLTTTITSEEYARLLFHIGQANRLAEAVAADWLASVGFSLNKPSDATLVALRRFDLSLHTRTARKVAEAEAKNEETARKAADILGNFTRDPVQHLTPDENPLRIEVGDRPDLEPKITCDSGNN